MTAVSRRVDPVMDRARPIVEVLDLSHRYSSAWAIREIHFEIRKNGIVGLLGSNGAGKSTTMNILCGVLSPTDGVVRIDGIDLREKPEEAKQRIGFLPQNPPLYLDFTVDEYLTYCAHLRLVRGRDVKAAVDDAKERCGVGHFSNRLIGNLSGGYKQRVGIAQAIIHKPKLVVLDEPTNGLDPIQIVEVRALIKAIAEEHAVLFSTHILSEVQATCRDIIMIEAGEMVFHDSVETFSKQLAPDSIVARLGAVPDLRLLRAIRGIASVETMDDGAVRMAFDGLSETVENFVRASVENGWCLREVYVEKISLESVFSHLSNSAAGAQARRQ